MKKALSFFLALILLILGTSTAVFAEEDPISQIELDSQGAYLVNTQTDTVLYAKAENSRTFPASLTKIMTALVVLQECTAPSEETIRAFFGA